MKTLYVDNFRGFSNTYIPLHDVNFFIGENSTGKTSILSLLYLLSSPDFWFQQKFNIPGSVQLGNFDDMVSVDSKKKKYFRFGMIDIDSNLTFLLTFEKKDGIPVIHRYDFLVDRTEFNILFKENIEYKISREKKHIDIAKVYKGWVNNDDKNNFKEYKCSGKHIKDINKDFFYVANFLIMQKKNKNIEHSFDKFRLPDFFSHLNWIAPIRTKPKRTYDQIIPKYNSSEGEHTPYLIKKILSKNKSKKEFLKFIEKFGKESSLFRTISIENYGKGESSPFRLNVFLNKNELNIDSVGYGVSQCIPIVVDLFNASKKTWFAIQQPEVHLHPKAQATLGDSFFEFATKDNKKFFIETHSDFIIDRFKINYKRNRNKKDIKNLKSQLLFFERKSDGNYVSSINIDKNGKYSDNQPDSFRDFFIKEEMNLLEL